MLLSGGEWMAGDAGDSRVWCFVAVEHVNWSLQGIWPMACGVNATKCATWDAIIPSTETDTCYNASIQNTADNQSGFGARQKKGQVAAERGRREGRR
jgi:hypothetical protein